MLLTSTQKQVIASQLAKYTKIENICWIILGILQVLSIYGIIAGIWNIIGGIYGFETEKRILRRDKKIPIDTEDCTSIIVFGVINVLFGGVIGIGIVIYWWWIRQEILKNKDIFDGKGSGTYCIGNLPNTSTTKTYSSNSGMDTLQELELCAKLYKQGTLTKKEYETKKKQLLEQEIEEETSVEDDLYSKIEQLAKLLDKKLITRKEFEEQKKQLLDDYL